MPTLTRADFVERYARPALRTEDLAASRRLRDLRPREADSNGNGRLEPDELPALFDQLADGRDRLSPTATQRRLFGLGAARTVTTEDGRALEALDSVARAPVNTAPGEVGHDPFMPEVRMPKGPYAGERLDTESARSAVRLDDEAVALYARRAGVDPEDIALGFANLRQKFIELDGSARHTWSVALVPRDAVDNVALLRETFPAPVPAAHTLLRFTLKPNRAAFVVPQVEGDERPVERQQNLALSIEAIGPKGWQYDLVSGVRDHFATSYNLETVESRFRHAESYDEPHPVDQLPLKLTDAQKQRVLEEAVNTATSAGMERMYNTLSRNCTNELFGVLDRGVGRDVGLRVHAARALTTETLPTLADLYLRLRGLLDTSRTLPTLREEMTPRDREHGGLTHWRF